MVTKWPQNSFLTISGSVVTLTLTFDLLTWKCNSFILVQWYQNCKFGELFPSDLQEIVFTNCRDARRRTHGWTTRKHIASSI